MFNNKRQKPYRGDGNGFSWPHADSATPATIEDVFGPRPFSTHSTTVGYNYDFHRGIDILLPQGSLVYSPINGSIIRTHFTHFGWENNTQLQQWTETDPGGTFAYSLKPGLQGTGGLVITGSRAGAQTFPTNVGYISPIKERVIIQHSTDPWVIETQFSNPISVTGAFGIGLLDTTTTPNQYVSLEYDGNAFTVFGNDEDGALSANNTIVSSSGKTWMRMTYIPSTTAISWSHSTNGTTFTSLAKEATTNFTNKTVGIFKPVLYWRSIDTNATPEYITLSASNWYDAEQIARFGNWIEVGDASKKILVYHLQDLLVDRGQVVHAGQPIGTVGSTGFNDRSGRVLSSHIHLETISNNGYVYDNDDPINPLASIYLPISRSNTNISGTITDENDPLGNASHKLTLVSGRADQEFVLNQIFLTGSTTARMINFNTRGGLDDDNDIPVVSGVYIVPQAFSGSSSTYELAVYFNKSVVGNTFLSYTASNADGATVTVG